MLPRILLVDDDVELAEMLRDYLLREGFAAHAVHEGATALAALRGGGYALAVIDVMMPGMSGIEVLRSIRADSALPVLMLTARGDDAERVLGLELGADDYVPKPCTPRELLARIRAILRRSSRHAPGSDAAHLTVGDLSLWPEQRLATCGQQTLALTSTEFSLLEVLMRQAGRAVSKAALSEQGLGREFSRYDRTIDVHISSIRQKLAPLADGRSRIQTVFRKGYQLVRESFEGAV
jgi:two-component system, OmpR family, response regulator